MSWHDRPYSQEPDSTPQLRLQFRRPGSITLWLVIANVAVHFIHIFSLRFSPTGFLDIFGLSLYGVTHLYLWQPVTYMFVHEAGTIWHLAFNMLMLYFIGSEIERFLGRDRYLKFYGLCGIVGGLAYLGLAVIDPAYYDDSLKGASGAIFGLLLAGMIFFPQMRIIFIIFPMPIRVFGGILIAMFLLQAIGPEPIENLGGEICHIAGAITGLIIFKAWGMLPRVRVGAGDGFAPLDQWREKRRAGAWDRQRKREAAEEAEVDRILAKVHDRGLQSLTRTEKKILSKATQNQKSRDRGAGRIDRL